MGGDAMLVPIMLAATLFTALMVIADRFASRWTVEDPVVLAQRRHARRSRRRGVVRVRPTWVPRARTRRPAAEPQPPPRRPLQVVAADLRRLVHEMALVPSGATLVRWKALWAAYDGVLVEAAEMLELHQELAAQPPGLARDIERVRVLAALEDAGLMVRV
jgi:hypothetical protein